MCVRVCVPGMIVRVRTQPDTDAEEVAGGVTSPRADAVPHEHSPDRASSVSLVEEGGDSDTACGAAAAAAACAAGGSDRHSPPPVSVPSAKRVCV